MPVITPPTVSALPAAPDPNDRSTFNARAYPWSVAINTLTGEINAATANVAANANDAAASATTATTQAGLAATAKTNADTAAALASDWAIKTASPVAGGEYSAKYWAQIAQGVVATIPTGTINDGATSTTSVWSSSKTSTELAGKASVSSLASKVGGSTADNIGYLNIPQTTQSAAYTIVLADAGKHILHPSADTTARTFTIPANSAVAFPVGTAITFVNQNGAGVVTIAITTDTMRLAGTGTTGSRTLAANGVATAIKLTATEWIISGTGLT